MSRMLEECTRVGKIWVVTVAGEPLGLTFKNDSNSLRELEDARTVPTEAAAQRVSKAFKAWIEDRFPGKSTPKSQYWVAFPDAPIKVFPARNPESEVIRRRNGNHFQDQGDAYTASQALRWLLKRERDMFEKVI